MQFLVKFMSRDLEDKTVEADSYEALQQMYLDGELDGDQINNGTALHPESITISEITCAP